MYAVMNDGETTQFAIRVLLCDNRRIVNRIVIDVILEVLDDFFSKACRQQF